jgi:alpha-beta hydrolase superfamily lysophospholipase
MGLPVRNPYPQVDWENISYHPLLECLRKEISPDPSRTRIETRWFTASDGTRLFVRHWPALITPEKGKIICFHGLGGDGEYYILLADQLVQFGYSVTVYDHYGHGLSTGPRGDIQNFFLYCQYAAEFLHEIVKQRFNTPIFVMGESLGGTVIIDTIIRYDQLPQISGIILLSPGIKLKSKSPSFQDLIKFLTGLVLYPFIKSYPIINLRATQSMKIVNGKSIMNPIHFEYDRIHPWHLDALSIRYIIQLRRGFSFALTHGPKAIKSPILIYYGLNDSEIDQKGVELFFNQIQAKDKKLIEIPGVPHAMFTHHAFQSYWVTLREWLEQHL